MKILALGLDNSILKKNSPLAARAVEYGELVEEYYAIVPAVRDEEAGLVVNVRAFGVGGLKLFKLFKIYSLGKKLAAREKFNVVTVQDQYYLALAGLFLARKIGAGLEIQVHGFEKFSGLRKIVARFVLKRADGIRAVSRRLKEKLISEFGADEKKITVAPIFSDRQKFLATESRAGKNKIPQPTLSRGVSPSQSDKEDLGVSKHPREFIFLTVGRLVRVKNIAMQIRALSRLADKDSKLWIIGDGPERKKLEGLSGHLDLKNRVKFFGRQENLKKFFSQADAFLLTSDSEGWGLAAVEAAAIGLAIVMTDVGLAGEVLKDGESAIIIRPEDEDALVLAMEKIIADGKLRARLGRAAREAVLKLPSKKETLGLYKESWERVAR